MNNYRTIFQTKSIDSGSPTLNWMTRVTERRMKPTYVAVRLPLLSEMEERPKTQDTDNRYKKPNSESEVQKNVQL